MITIGVGNTGMILATMFSDKPRLFSTAKEDSTNFNGKYDVSVFAREGASKRFSIGCEIWQNNIDELRSSLEKIVDEKVIIFSSLGGGSGSSSLRFFSEILLEQRNKVIIFAVLPYKKELNPPLANAVQAINNLMPIISGVSVMLFDNEKLLKMFENNWESVNAHIIKRADYIINLLKKYNDKEFSPLTLDQSELDSVIFGGGFLDFSDTFLEEKMPKLEYGTLDKTTKNCLVAMYVDDSIPEKKMEKYHKTLTDVLGKLSGRVSNARLIPGILRAKVNRSNSEDDKIWDRAYITIASGLNIDKYLEKISKMKENALDKAKNFSKEYRGKDFIGDRSGEILDI
jgi:hypothetical protein